MKSDAQILATFNLILGVAVRGAAEGMQVYFARDRENQYSRNAVAIFMDTGGMIGYVPPKGEAYQVAAYLEVGFKAKLRIKKLPIRTRSGYPIPVVDGEIYRTEADVPFALTQAETENLNFALPNSSDWRATFRKAEATPQLRNDESKSQGIFQSCLTCAVVIIGALILMFLAGEVLNILPPPAKPWFPTASPSRKR